jgi:hypothetical protein
MAPSSLKIIGAFIQQLLLSVLLLLLMMMMMATAKGLARGAPVVSGMIGLAELRLEAGDAAGALAAAKQGLKFVFDRSKVNMRLCCSVAYVQLPSVLRPLVIHYVTLATAAGMSQIKCGHIQQSLIAQAHHAHCVIHTFPYTADPGACAACSAGAEPACRPGPAGHRAADRRRPHLCAPGAARERGRGVIRQ